MQPKNVGKAVYYLVVILTLSSLTLFACGGGGDGDNGDNNNGGGGGNGTIRNVDATETLGANNAQLAGQLLAALPPITIAGSAFDPDIRHVTLDFVTTGNTTTFTMTGGNLPAAGVSGTVSFSNSCTFTFSTSLTALMGSH